MPRKTNASEVVNEESVEDTVNGEIVEDTEKSAKEDMNEEVEIFLQKERGLNAKSELTINVNGKDFKIKLGKRVKVPKYVYLAILSRENDRDFEDDFIRLNKRYDL